MVNIFVILMVVVVLYVCVSYLIADHIKGILTKNDLNWNQWKPAGPRKIEGKGRWTKIVDVWKHKLAYLKIQTNHWHITLRGIFHDADKLVLLLTNFWLKPKEISEYHKIRSHHHSKATSDLDFRYQIIDYECSQLTKPDAPMRAYEYITWKHKKGGISDEDFARYMKLMEEMKIRK